MIRGLKPKVREIERLIYFIFFQADRISGIMSFHPLIEATGGKPVCIMFIHQLIHVSSAGVCSNSWRLNGLSLLQEKVIPICAALLKEPRSVGACAYQPTSWWRERSLFAAIK